MKKTILQQAKKDAQAALAEDVGQGDLSADLVEDRLITATLICRQPAVLCGQDWFEACFMHLTPVGFAWAFQDGDLLPGDNKPICQLSGGRRTLLSAERSALNFLQTLSATATKARCYRQQVGESIRLMDTRKTLPLLRVAQKYASAVGGFCNHRMGLFDEILLKENHLAALGGVSSALKAAFKRYPADKIQIEVTTLQELKTALNAGAKRILLDNFSISQLHQAVQLAGADIECEASGNINLDNISAFAQTKVNRLSIGDVTKNCTAIDFSLLFSQP